MDCPDFCLELLFATSTDSVESSGKILAGEWPEKHLLMCVKLYLVGSAEPLTFYIRCPFLLI